MKYANARYTYYLENTHTDEVIKYTNLEKACRYMWENERYYFSNKLLHNGFHNFSAPQDFETFEEYLKACKQENRGNS